MAEWTMQGKGWWTSALGGVADEGGRKWYFYPREGQERFGPFRTKNEAISLAERPARVVLSKEKETEHDRMA